MERKKVLLAALGIAFVLILTGCGADKNEISIDEWTTLSLEDENGNALSITLPPELAEKTREVIKDERTWGAHYNTDYSNFTIYISILENSAGYSEDLLHALMGSDIRYMSENMFEEMQVSSFLSAPKSEKGEKTIHDKNWKYCSLSGASKNKTGGSAAACEYVHIRDSDLAQVVILYSAKNKASKEEKNLLDQWYDLIPKTLEFKNQAE